jgi:hypothetical protein
MTGKPDDLLPGGLRFTLSHPVEVQVEGDGLAPTTFHLDDKDVLEVVQRAWRRRTGRPDGRRGKLGMGTIEAVLAIESYVHHHGRNPRLTAGALAAAISRHAANVGISDRLRDDGPLWNLCDQLLAFWQQRERFKTG